MSKKETLLPILSGAVTSIIFGLSFLFSKRALNVADPYSLLSFRFLLAFSIMTILMLCKVIKIDYKGKNIKNLLFLGLMQPIVYFIFETYGIKFSSSSQAGLMIALIPIVVSILSAYILKEKPSNIQVIFIVLSVLGVMFIVIMGNSNAQGSGSLFGTILLFGAVFSGSIFSILSRKFSQEFSAMELTYAMMGLAAIYFNGISLFNHIKNNNVNEYFSPLKNSDFLTSILYLGILSSIIAFFLINYTLSKIEASKSAVLSNLSTIVSIIAGVLIMKESFEYYHLIGSILILIGVFGTNYFGFKKETSQDITA